MQKKTREEIKRACLKLLDELPLSQVTVKAIVQECGINRNSFYYYFTDVPALLEEIVMDNADKLIAEYSDVASLEECLVAATRFARENKRIVLHIYRSARRDLFEQYLSRVCHDVVVSYSAGVYESLPEGKAIAEDDKELMIRYYQCELFGQIVLWLESDMKYDIQKQFSRLLELRSGFGMEIIHRSLQSSESGR